MSGGGQRAEKLRHDSCEVDIFFIYGIIGSVCKVRNFARLKKLVRKNDNCT